jgi:streptogramin lyase
VSLLVAGATALAAGPLAGSGGADPSTPGAAAGAPRREFAPSDTAAIQEFPLPAASSPFPQGITAGPDGNVWFTELFTNSVGRLTPGGSLTQFPLKGDGQPNRIATGPDGRLWISNQATTEQFTSRVDRLSTSGVDTTFTVGAQTGGVTAGPDGNIWFTEPFPPQVLRVTPAGRVTTFPLPVADGASAGQITAGADGNLWVSAGTSIARVTPSGSITEYPIPAGELPPGAPQSAEGIAPGPGGDIWFTEPFANRIGKLDIHTHAIAQFHIPTTSSFPQDITAGPDGNMWFTETFGNRLGRITPGGAITEVHVPTPNAGPYGITTGPDGMLWFTEQLAGKVARLDPTTLRPPAGPCLTVTADTTLTHDIGPCEGDGIVVTRSGITLDLGGHRVFGTPAHLGDFAGIHLLDVRGVTVRRGSVSGFDAGVLIDFGGNNTVTGLYLHDNIGSPEGATNMGDGLAAVHSDQNRISHNVLRHNGIFDGISILGVDSHHNTIERNTVERSADEGAGDLAPGAGTGIIVNPFLEAENPRRGEPIIENDIIHNVVRDNTSSGISSLSNFQAHIRGNVAKHNGFLASGEQNFPGNGMGVSSLFRTSTGTQDLVERNRLTDNAQSGIQVFSESNRFVGNVADGNLNFDYRDENPGCDSNVWLDNVWGSGGYFPRCVGASGSGPRPHAAAGPAPAPAGTGPAATAPAPARRGAALEPYTRGRLAHSTAG